MRILQLTWGGERKAGEIAAELPVSFGAVSQHLKRLHVAGLVERRVEGKHRFYRAAPDKLEGLSNFLEQYWECQLDRLAQAVEADSRSRK